MKEITDRTPEWRKVDRLSEEPNIWMDACVHEEEYFTQIFCFQIRFIDGSWRKFVVYSTQDGPRIFTQQEAPKLDTNWIRRDFKDIEKSTKEMRTFWKDLNEGSSRICDPGLFNAISKPVRIREYWHE